MGTCYFKENGGGIGEEGNREMDKRARGIICVLQTQFSSSIKTLPKLKLGNNENDRVASLESVTIFTISLAIIFIVV